MRKKIHQQILQEDQFDSSVWQKARIQNNSGYISPQYETTQQFPTIPDYHFRIQDDQAILELQKCSLNDTPLQPVNFDRASDKFHNKLQGLLEGLNIANQNKQKYQNTIQVEKHGFYSLQKDYDDQAGIKQAFNRIQVTQVENQMEKLSLQDKKPKFIKKVPNPNKMKDQGAAPMASLSKQFSRLTISQQDL